MANEIVTLPAALDNPEGRDMVREMLAQMASMTMASEVESLCGAGYGARSEAMTLESWLNQGYKLRTNCRNDKALHAGRANVQL